mmetsp:Transcript_54775/g.46122  ORF Transcript_54775/g.46122 Transcript_54775/m.46122 type:complete len:218 (+) Transcript_54775:1594-2247(+)
MEIKTSVENPIKIMFMINAVIPVPQLNCAGAETNLTKSHYLGCNDEGTAASGPCDLAFSPSEFWETNGDPSIITISFKTEVKPTKIIYVPKGAAKPAFITVVYDPKHSERLELIGDKFEWMLEKSQSLTKLTINMDKASGVHLEVYGSQCSDPIEEEKLEVKKEQDKLGVKPKIKVNPVDCWYSQDQMTLDQTIVECKEECKMMSDGVNNFERIGDN